MPVYHSGRLSKTQRPDYNYPLRPQTRDLTVPLAPRNLIVTSPYIVGMADIRWDNPNLIPENNGCCIVGVNVYRSTDNPYGVYEKLNDTPVTALFYRDQTQEQLVQNEDATSTLRYIEEPDNKWLIWTQYKPIIKPESNGDTSFRPEDVLLEIDDGDGQWLEIPAFAVNGSTGEITLINKPTFNYDLEQIIPARLPIPPDGKVRVTYRYLKHAVVSRLNQRIFYKVTTVCQDPDNPGQYLETPLDEVSARSTFDMEEVDWIWREAIKRNYWILEQAGERVKVFIRKWMGELCDSHEYAYGQSYHDCGSCFGTNYKGGFDGPYDIIIAPPETERSIELFDMGLHMRYDWLTWTSDFPLLNERDVVVRQNNERYVVGPVNYQGSRGAIYQQHFTLSHMDEKDIRYKLPITGGETSVPESSDIYREARKSDASPVINEKPEIPEPRIIRGKTVTFENITWILVGFVIKLIPEIINNLFSVI